MITFSVMNARCRQFSPVLEFPAAVCKRLRIRRDVRHYNVRWVPTLLTFIPCRRQPATFYDCCFSSVSYRKQNPGRYAMHAKIRLPLRTLGVLWRECDFALPTHGTRLRVKRSVSVDVGQAKRAYAFVVELGDAYPDDPPPREARSARISLPDGTLVRTTQSLRERLRYYAQRWRVTQAEVVESALNEYLS